MSEGDPSVRYNTDFESSSVYRQSLNATCHIDSALSSSGISSDFTTWQVACIMIALTLGLSAIVLLALCCHDRKKRKISGEEETGETSIFTDDEKPAYNNAQKGSHLEVSVAPNMTNRNTPSVSKQSIPDKSNKVAEEKNKENNSEKPVDGTLYLQRNAGVYNKGNHFEPLPPLPTSVFLISLPTPTDYNSIHPISERYI